TAKTSLSRSNCWLDSTLSRRRPHGPGPCVVRHREQKVDQRPTVAAARLYRVREASRVARREADSVLIRPMIGELAAGGSRGEIWFAAIRSQPPFPCVSSVILPVL